MFKVMWKKIMLSIVGVVATLGALWYAIFGLKPYEIDQQTLLARYSYQQSDINMVIEPLDEHFYAFTYTSFDGAKVNGRMALPEGVNWQQVTQQKVPILIGIHAMGRSENRWWMESFKDRPTLEQTDKIAEQALTRGYAVIAIDSRNHGKRKNKQYTIIDTMEDLHYWGKRVPYETMIVDTVRDYRVLLDWLDQQPMFDPSKTTVAGYSMGAQVALLLAGTDDRIEQVLSIVPPYLDDKVAVVAPKNIVSALKLDRVWLVTANDDEYASKSENEALFAEIPTIDKKHIQLDGDHILPQGYYQSITGWYE